MTGPSPTDRAIRGNKRSARTDALGLSTGVCIAGAKRNDAKMTTATIDRIPGRRRAAQQRRQHLCLDKGCDYAEVYQLARRRRYEGHI